MKKNLNDIVKSDLAPKDMNLEVQEYIGEILIQIIEENNVEVSEEQQDELINNLMNIIDYNKVTDEYIKNYFESILKISK